MDYGEKVRVCNWFISVVPEGLIDLNLTFSQTRLILIYLEVNSQNDRYWRSESFHALIQPPISGHKIGVWRVISANRIIGPTFYVGNLDAEPIFRYLGTREERLGYFLQDDASPHTAKETIRALGGVPVEVVNVNDTIISKGLWQPRSPDLNPCEFICGEH
jgi:hypothetical protein